MIKSINSKKAKAESRNLDSAFVWASLKERHGIPASVIFYNLERESRKKIDTGERASYFLPPKMASLAALATRNFTTRLAGILMAAPV
jgi:hypothetical protein